MLELRVHDSDLLIGVLVLLLVAIPVDLQEVAKDLPLYMKDALVVLALLVVLVLLWTGLV